MTNLTIENLLANGYTQHPGEHAPTHHADCFFQKRVRDHTGNTLYFIDIFHYARSFSDGSHGWQPEVQLYLDRDHTRNLDLTLGGFKTLEEIEDFISNAYSVLRCHPDDEIQLSSAGRGNTEAESIAS